jgi:small subunit ribosomal protein S6
MRHYEVTFIVDPVLSGDELKATAQAYVDMIQSEGFSIVHIDEMGLRPLAYPIKKRHSGVYFCIEFSGDVASFIDRLELALRRDERIMRFLSVSLDKFGVKYNDDKRKGLIGNSRKNKAKDAVPAETASKPVLHLLPLLLLHLHLNQLQ